MNILAILGSPNSTGHSAKLLNSFLEQFNDHNIETIAAYDYCVEPCTDCGYCSKVSGYCWKQDKMLDIYKSIDRAQIIIIATPIYYNSVPSPLKAIIDRTMCLYCRKFRHKADPGIKKYGILLTSSGDNDNKAVDAVSSQIKLFFDVCNASVFAEIFEINTDAKEYDEETLIKVKQAANQLLKDISGV